MWWAAQLNIQLFAQSKEMMNVLIWFKACGVVSEVLESRWTADEDQFKRNAALSHLRLWTSRAANETEPCRSPEVEVRCSFDLLTAAKASSVMSSRARAVFTVAAPNRFNDMFFRKVVLDLRAAALLSDSLSLSQWSLWSLFPPFSFLSGVCFFRQV